MISKKENLDENIDDHEEEMHYVPDDDASDVEEELNEIFDSEDEENTLVSMVAVYANFDNNLTKLLLFVIYGIF